MAGSQSKRRSRREQIVKPKVQLKRNAIEDAKDLKIDPKTLDSMLRKACNNLVDAEPDAASSSDFVAVLAHNMLNSPSFSLRGGTREILRGIIARGLGLR